MTKNPKVTLSDVAARAGMSQATASRALRGFKVHRKYQGKAEAAAAELGYVLNESARALRSVRTMTVGMVYHDLTSMLGMELLRATATGLDEIGYSLFISTAQGRNDHFDSLVHRFLQRRVDALVCVHGNGEGAALQGYISAGIPVMALITKSGGYNRLPLVGPTIKRAAGECAGRLVALGHRRAVILSSARAPELLNTLEAAAKSRNLETARVTLGEAATDAEIADMLRTLRNKPARPTVIFGFLRDASRILEAAAKLRIKVPADLSVVAIRDRSTIAGPALSNLSTIHLNPAPMGLLAADVLKQWLVDGRPLTRDRRIEIGEWTERETTGPAPA